MCEVVFEDFLNLGCCHRLFLECCGVRKKILNPDWRNERSKTAALIPLACASVWLFPDDEPGILLPELNGDAPSLHVLRKELKEIVEILHLCRIVLASSADGNRFPDHSWIGSAFLDSPSSVCADRHGSTACLSHLVREGIALLLNKMPRLHAGLDVPLPC